MTEQAIKNVFDQAEEFTPTDLQEAPRPLRRPLQPAQDYPVELLGKGMARVAQAIRNKIQSPAAICAQSVLATVNLAIQGHADVVLHTGQSRPSSCYLLTVADSGERKTSSDTEAMMGIDEYEQALRLQYDKELAEYANDHAAWERQRFQILNDQKKYPTQASKKASLDELGDAPPAPLFPAINCPEPTFEGLCKVLAIGQPSMGLFSNEGGQFVGGYGMKEDNRLKTASGMSDMWDGKAIKRVRSGDGALILPGRRLCLHLMVQPMVFSQFYADRLLESQGILAAPDSVAGTRMFRAATAEDERVLHDFTSRILAILQTPLPLAGSKRNEMSPRRLKLSNKARELLIQYSDSVEKRLAEGQQYYPIKSLANKLAEHAARLAATKALFVDLQVQEVDGATMSEAIGLAEFYAKEALRLRGGICSNPTLLLAEKTLMWMHTKLDEPLVSLPDIYQFGPHGVEDKATATKVVEMLRDHGWLVPVPGGATVKGQKRRDVWRIIRP